ncbi:MAG: AAA family ATPase [Deltaproteobacteria bacterium]|jgi:exonuclease SbcC|nr:AAA family ATPase [Deltaproteobacteria bacterium]MBW2532292.1 AAA family ATPase [Deltaproteobacteria bacterium]
MRILAVRGQNLASLERFDVDFEQGLGGSGLFAITGPTGAGKSTLLDAICLPLFNKTPRLGGSSKIKVSLADGSADKGLTLYDVRGILRRGAGAGWAEVDLLADDGTRYRARWSVQRARKKVTGRIQKVELAFEDLDRATRLGEGINQTLEVVQERVGLTFQQFCRSVLLAQGDFAAFLEASEKDRAELLERMTGTEIYGELSQKAYGRAQEIGKELQDVERRLADRAPLDADARQQLEAELTERQAALDGLSEQKKRSEAYLEATRRTASLRERIAKATEDKQRASDAQAAAVAALEQSEQARRVLAVVELREAERLLDALREAVLELARRRGELDAWREEHARLEPLGAEWPRWNAAFEELDAVRRELADLVGRAGAIAAAHDEAVTAVSEAKVRLEEATARLAQAEQAEQEAAQAFEPAELDAVDEALALQQRTVSELEQMERYLEDARSSDGAVREGKTTVAGLQQELKDLAQRSADRTEQQERLGIELGAAQRALSHARDAMSLEERRAELTEGKPCPLCGSTHHPYAGEAFDQLLSTHQAEVDRLEQERDAVTAELAELRAAIADRKANLAAQEATLEQLRSKRAGALAGWSARADALELPGDALAARAGAELAQRKSVAEQRLGELGGRKAALVEGRKQLDARRGETKRALADRDVAKDAAVAAEANAQRARAKLDENREAIQRTQATVEARREALEPPLAHLSGWWTLYEEDPASFRKARAADADDWTRQDGALAEVTKTMAVQEAREQELARSAGQVRSACLASLDSDAVAEELGAQAEAWMAEQLGRLADDARAAAVAEAQAHNERQTQGATKDRHDADTQIAAQHKALEIHERELSSAEAEQAERLQALGVADEESFQPHLAKLDEEHVAAQQAVDEARLALKQDDANRLFQKEEGERLEAKRADAERWSKLNELIGSADGAKFRKFAQNLTLAQMLAQANRRLEELAPRYRLQPVPGQDLALQVLDCDMGNEIRSVASLSGGESFLVSLALALGLASLSAQRIRVESMFIDEGFGSLDADTLDVAISTLDSLQATGRQIGIISHVSGLAERIGRQVRVEKVGGGRSRVDVLDR